MASVLGCGVSKLPLTYLGLHVGCNMGRCENWKCIIQKFSSKMSQWKVLLLLVGGRLSLIKSVVGGRISYYMSLYLMPATVQKVLESMRNMFFIRGNLDEKKVTWVKWNTCLASKAMGGLGIGSIYALNVSLLFKWIWIFRCYTNDLWAKVIKGIHGQHGGIGTERLAKSNASPWNVIVRSVSQLQLEGIDLLSSCNRSLGDGKSIVFWEESWCGDRPLKELFPRVYALDRDKRCTALISNVELSENKDGWKWALNSTGFSVASARKYSVNYYGGLAVGVNFDVAPDHTTTMLITLSPMSCEDTRQDVNEKKLWFCKNKRRVSLRILFAETVTKGSEKVLIF
ncbi:RNA-directed DNA polymerase, eukaryota, Reverse transcriptase zinc-binding domain protein [Artemisia annua]|uniref:RNA-directed DNA polymerase, eukaryota, Reverse transcriptase zinc-binding domain protein n=1 Tax=Artemisia annua TaxID=35608 RepID=A0A2U1KXW7_ARTAN|nr:RNA-directed DNA polymerase, eukaryota, Reverse transcriptase zinc-binding domain protein [Artemisia annua]